MTELTERAMLVNLSISAWTGRKYDRNVSNVAEKQFDAHEAGRYNKLLIGKTNLKKIQTIVSEARNYHYFNTLPWSDDGPRILTAANYFEYMEKMKHFKDEYEMRVGNFIEMYPQLKEDAKSRLNKMYSEGDYPGIEALKSKYRFSTQFIPIPRAKDFRVILQDEEVNIIKEQIEEEVKESVNNAVRDLWKRLFKVVEHLLERLDKSENKFKDSLINNIKEVCKVLPKLNITNDPRLEEAVNEIKEKLTTHTPQTLREDMGVRNKTVKDAQNILNKMRQYAI